MGAPRLTPRRLVIGAGALGAAGALAWSGWAAERSAVRALRADEAEVLDAGLGMPADVTHHFIETSDHARIHAVEKGSGPPVLLVHGITLGASVWAPQLRTLSEDHRVIAVDLRGHGLSVVGSDGVGFDRQALDLEEVIVDLGLEGAVLVGHSMGGMISQVLMSSRRAEVGSRVSQLMLLDTSSGPLSVPSVMIRAGRPLSSVASRGLQRAAARGASVLPGEDLATWLVRASFGRRPAASQVELTRSLTQSVPAGLIAQLARPLLTFDSRPLLGSIEVPTTVVVGSVDLLTPPRHAKVLARSIPGAALVVVPGAGHMVMLEAPEQLNELVRSLAATSVR